MIAHVDIFPYLETGFGTQLKPQPQCEVLIIGSTGTRANIFCTQDQLRAMHAAIGARLAEIDAASVPQPGAVLAGKVREEWEKDLGETA